MFDRAQKSGSHSRQMGWLKKEIIEHFHIISAFNLNHFLTGKAFANWFIIVNLKQIATKCLKFYERAAQFVYYGSRFFGRGYTIKTSLIKTLHFCRGLGLKSLFFALKKRLFIDFVSFFKGDISKQKIRNSKIDKWMNMLLKL